MTADAAPTACVTGAGGLIRRELVNVLVARGFPVFGLARSVESSERLRDAGAVAIRGDVLVPGQWQDEAATDWVFHIPPCGAPRRRFPLRGGIGHTRAVMDWHLLDAVAAGAPRRVTALPGCVFGNGSWFRQRVVDPVMAGRRARRGRRTDPRGAS